MFLFLCSERDPGASQPGLSTSKREHSMLDDVADCEQGGDLVILLETAI